MKILHIHDVAYVGSTLVKSLRLIGHDADLVRLRIPAARGSLLAKLLSIPLRIATMYSTNRYVKTDNYDVVHIHYAYLGWYGIIGKYPYYLHCHGTDVRVGLASIKSKWAIEKSLRMAKVVFVSTPDLLTLIRKIREDAIFVPNPINTDVFYPAERRKSNEKTRILIISRPAPTKGIAVALQAVAKLPAKYLQNAELTVFEPWEAPKNLQVSCPIHLVGFQSHSMMPDFINSHDIVIGQFGIGSLGVSELESMACAKPVITGFRFKDAYGTPPPIIAAFDADSISKGITELFEMGNQRRNIGIEAREWVIQNHGYLKVAKQIERYYS